ncbi:hypothetical protein [Thermodesulforhabdus norvegica]|uniref:Conjugal transfer protein TraB n=1 Tax=Thermodesulforhabdus norvegica TaxID=39841 RepID=A0A1I4QPS4_9BACT|nr:hypothetical protein [Thermodesulforhabdus norvegica]SFM41725.1 hypothetical protein SAMN05660836_00140 [Thermodesulforhabdus norvegica]
MHPDDEKFLKMAKEIVVKFIELGRISPSNFETHFHEIFWAIKKTAMSTQGVDVEKILKEDQSG